MELNVFHLDTFERLGIIDEYQSLEITTNYKKHSELELLVSATKENIDYFITKNDDIFLTTGIGNVKGFLIFSVKYTDEKMTTISVFCKSLGAMLGWRQIDGQQTFRGNVADIIRGYVTKNAINPTNIKRKISNLIIGSNNQIEGTSDEAFSNVYLDESLWEICLKFDIAYEIYADIINKKFSFTVWKGVDRSTNQSSRDAVIFSKEFDNVLSQHYTDDKGDYRNTIIIAGEDEGINRISLIVGDENVGRKRRETFVDAKDLHSSNEDETMSSSEYTALLRERAKNKQVEFERVQSFETDVAYDSQFIYNSDYFVGDLITVRNDEIGMTLHTRIVAAKEKYSRQGGYELSTEFGSNVPTLLNKIKKAVK